MKFRKKPVVIEAMQFTGTDSSRDAVMFWLDQHDTACTSSLDGVTIPTLEGNHLASPGDWIIQGVKG